MEWSVGGRGSVLPQDQRAKEFGKEGHYIDIWDANGCDSCPALVQEKCSAAVNAMQDAFCDRRGWVEAHCCVETSTPKPMTWFVGFARVLTPTRLYLDMVQHRSHNTRAPVSARVSHPHVNESVLVTNPFL